MATKSEKLAIGGIVTVVAAAGAAWLVIINVFNEYHKNFITKDEVQILVLEETLRRERENSK